ncbi:MAG: glycosyl hydrolase family 28-related protein [Lysobacter sp.]
MPALLSPVAKQQFFDSVGNPAAGHKLYAFLGGSSTPSTTYSDRPGTIANPHPIVLDARGEAVIYLQPGLVYDYQLRDPSGALIWSRAGIAAESDAAATVFLQEGAGAVSRSVQTKLREVVAASDFGVIADGITDMRSRLQAAIDYATQVGAVVSLPRGVVRISSPGVVIDNSTTTAYGAPRCSLRGEGPNASVLSADAGVFDVLSVLGGTTADGGVVALQSLEGFSILKADRFGTNLLIRRCTVIELSNLNLRNGDYGIRLVDVHTADFTRIHIGFANRGLVAGRGEGGFTDPNALSFSGCTIGGCIESGATFVGGSNINFIGGSFEGNGIGGSGSDRHHLAFVNAGNEGGAACNIIGTYFENGSGLADVFITNSQYPASYNIQGATFNRTSSDHAMTNCIRVDASVRSTLNVSGCGFKSFNKYSPSAARPYIAIADPNQPVKLNESGNLYEDAIENLLPAGPHASPRAMASAWVRFNGATGAILQSFNVASITRNGAGNYTINYSRSLSAANNVYALTLVGGPGSAYVANESAGSVTVFSNNPSGNATDFQMTVAVLGGSEIAG